MGKLTGAIKIKGKLKSADIVFVEGRNGTHIRSTPKVKTEKSAEYQRNADAAGTVATIAGQINRMFQQYARENTGVRMYTDLLSPLRKMKTGNRFIMLHSLIGLNSHSLKTISSLEMYPQVENKPEGRRLSASVSYQKHPKLGEHDKFYRVELIVVQWNSGTDEPVSMEQHSRWIAPGDAIKIYDFVFDLSEHCTDWLLLLRCRLAEEKGTKRLPPSDFVQIMDAGSFDEASVSELQNYLAAKKEAGVIKRQDWSEEDDGVEGR